jgi:TPR repeat protein
MRVPTEEPDGLPTVRGLSAGQKVFGRYVLEAVLGQGGMGVVWRARDEELGNLVALKFLPEIVARDEVAVDELKEETRNALRLTHPNIVRIYHFERDGTIAAVSMEFVDGAALSRLRLAQPGKAFSAEELAPLVVQLCAALEYAHGEAKVVHRDIKPANLLVTPDGRLKIADFGIARSLADTQTRLSGRTVGTSGTLLYMSPQQLLGKKSRAADDIYAFGATLYELLTSRPPFFTGDIATQVQSVTPPSLAERRSDLGIAGGPIPAAWEETVAACLAKDPALRPQTADEVAARLGLTKATYTVGASSLVQERSAAAGAGRAKPRMSPRVLLVAGLVVIALGFLAYMFWPKLRLASGTSHFDPAKAGPVMASFNETKAKAEEGNVDAELSLGWIYANGLGVKRDRAEAVKWYRLAAEQGNDIAQNYLGRLLWFLGGTTNGDPKDRTEAVKWFREAGAKGNAEAQCNLGLCYEEGDGVLKDSAKAVSWYRKASDQGHADAQYRLGAMYDRGEGVPKDTAEAMKWYRKAADQGHYMAQYGVGLAYAEGKDVPKDTAEAVRWYRKAADQGYRDAQCKLGVMYANGDGVPMDSAESLKWFRKAAYQDDKSAAYYLGDMYVRGESVPKDEIEALAWFNISAGLGNQQSVERRDELKKRLTPESVVAAQQRTQEIKENIWDEMTK